MHWVRQLQNRWTVGQTICQLGLSPVETQALLEEHRYSVQDTKELMTQAGMTYVTAASAVASQPPGDSGPSTGDLTRIANAIRMKLLDSVQSKWAVQGTLEKMHLTSEETQATLVTKGFTADQSKELMETVGLVYRPKRPKKGKSATKEGKKSGDRRADSDEEWTPDTGGLDSDEETDSDDEESTKGPKKS